MKPSAIIPCYNDHQELKKIVSTLQQSHLFSEIVIVDDGSDDHTQKILNQIQQATIIHHTSNLGKSTALKTGLKHCRSPIVLLLDADLVGLTVNHLKQLTTPVTSGRYDICIGEFSDPFKLFIKLGQTTMLSGLRCYRRKILDSHPEIFDNPGFYSGYLIEARSNQIIFHSQYKLVKTELVGLSQKYKWQKGNVLKGFINDLRVIQKIVNHLGFLQYLSQLKYSRCLQKI